MMPYINFNYHLDNDLNFVKKWNGPWSLKRNNLENMCIKAAKTLQVSFLDEVVHLLISFWFIHFSMSYVTLSCVTQNLKALYL